MSSSGFDYDISPFEGNLPPAFIPELMPEWDFEGGMDFRRAVEAVSDYAGQVHEWLKTKRTTDEAKWDLCRSYYDMDEDGKDDRERRASVFSEYAERTNVELNSERSSVLMPIIFESVQQTHTRLADQMFGRAPYYVEVLGRERNDIPGARVYEDVANYQQEYLIRTEDTADDLVNGGLVEGTGVVARTWDFDLNSPKDHDVNLRNIWLDPDERPHHEDRWNVWRRNVTLGELRRGRAKGMFWFSDRDITSALAKGPIESHRREKKLGLDLSITGGGKVEEGAEDHRLLTLDIFMQREGIERWVYRINESLVIGVLPNPIRKDSDGKFRWPFVLFAPIRKKGRKYGDSFVYRCLDVQDITNSIMHLLMSNMARNGLGLIFGDPNAFSGTGEIEAGKINPVDNPRESIVDIQLPDLSQRCISAIEYLRTEVSDKISGVTQSFRGQQVSASQTATSVVELANQANARLQRMERRSRRAVQEYNTLGLLLNQQYLQPTEAFRISQEAGVWRPVQGADFFGIAGKDIMPTGYPLSGSKTWWSQQGANIAGVVMQAAAQGFPANPIPLLRQVIEAASEGKVAIEEVFPQEAPVGQDPRQENELLAQGQVVPLHPKDDDWWHIQQHTPMFLWMEAQGFAMSAPQIVQNTWMHLQGHISRYTQMAAEMGQGGGGGGQGFGMPGLNAQMPQAQPKRPGETERQMEATRGAT